MVPSAFICNISLDVMRDPVIAPSGHSFERACIEQYLDRKSEDPITRRHLTKAMLVPNLALRKAIEEFLKQ
jgi:STIP1 family protein 1